MMVSTKQPIKCTATERILLHLVDYISQKDLFDVSPEITQEGISNAIQVQRKHLPRTFKRLREQECIIEEKKHVTGKKQQMKTYSLTEKGKSEAIRLKNYYADQIINVQINKEKMEQMTVHQTHSFFSGKYSYAFILSEVTINSEFNPQKRKNPFNPPTQNSQDFALTLYKKALQEAWKDGILTISEMNLLKALRKTLQISEKTHMKIQETILNANKKSNESLYQEIYELVLNQVLKDNKISHDEQEILNKLKEHFNIKHVHKTKEQ